MSITNINMHLYGNEQYIDVFLADRTRYYNKNDY